MQKIKIYGVVFLLSCLKFNLHAQDIHFSHFYQSPMTLNPALTGVFNGDMRLLTNYKDQWKNVATAYKTFAASCDFNRLLKEKFKHGFLGAGLSVFSDKAGDAEMGITQVNLSLSSSRSLDERNSVSVGLQGGFAQRSINFDKLYWDKQYDQTTGVFDPTASSGETFTSNKFTYIDFAAGVNWNYGKGEMYSTANDQFRANFGAAMYHINKPQQSFLGNSDEKLYSKMVLHGSMLIGIKNTNYSFVPSFMFLKQGSSQEILAGTMLRYMLKEESRYTGYVKGAAISFGGHYRVKDAMVASMLLEVANYAIGVSYDVNTSDLKPASSGRGGIEFSLRFITPNPMGGKQSHGNARFL